METTRTVLVDIPEKELLGIIEVLTPQKIATFCDVTDLKADTKEEKIAKIVGWAKDYGCASVCVNPVEVDSLAPMLRGSDVKECYVIDFPLGRLSVEMKAKQAEDVVRRSRRLRGESGKVELDMVMNVGYFKRDPTYTKREIESVVTAADGEWVKVIIRSSELTEDEIRLACRIVKEAGARFVKNSTGMDPFGAFPEHIRLMRETVGSDMGVKAAGGIKDAMTVVRLIYAGAKESELRTPSRFRIGTSTPVNIISTMGWLNYAAQGWVEAGVIPCTICPHNYTSKQRTETREIYTRRCRDCPYNKFRKDKDF